MNHIELVNIHNALVERLNANERAVSYLNEALEARVARGENALVNPEWFAAAGVDYDRLYDEEAELRGEIERARRAINSHDFEENGWVVL